MKLHKFLEKNGYQSVALTQIPSGHYILRARINNIKGIFILDTGASNTTIDVSKTKYFKLKAKDSKHKATGAGTTEIEIQTAKKNKVRIKKVKLKKITLVLMDLSHINQALKIMDVEVDGIIGADILHQAKGIIQYDKDLLFLKA